MTTPENVQVNTNQPEAFPIFMDLEGIVAQKGLIEVSINVGSKIEKDPKKAISYVFTINEELYLTEIGVTVDTFRLEHNKETKENKILISSENGFYIQEDVTALFKDESMVFKECIKQDETKFVWDITEEFIEYWNTPEYLRYE
ncbi:hypothetical protein [Priestia aryabhattai]